MESEVHDYLKSLRLKVAGTTYRRKYWQIGIWFKYLAEGKKLWTEATRQDVESFLLSRQCSRSFRQSLCVVIREFYEFHQRQNPAAGIRFKKDDRYRLPKVPGKASMDEIIGRLSGHGDHLRIRDRLIMELAYGSGLRRDELRRLNIEDVDLEGETVRVLGKGDRVRIVPLTSPAVAITREYLVLRRAARGPLLVSFMGRRLSANGIYQICRDRIGIRPHLLRHACATHMLANGASIRAIQELLGHADLKATQVYTAVEKGVLRGVVNARHPRVRG
jgi:integrase/recombinase XerC